jgi:hypothetical protein
MLKTFALLMLSTLALSSGASGCHAKQNAALPTQTPNTETSTKAPKILAEGFHSLITNPFIAVIRDAVTYAELKKLDDMLPKLDAEFFNSHAVVAAYLGTRNTGGYSVEIRWGTGLSVGRTPAKPSMYIEEKAPAKGVMVPQMITSPFKVVSLEVNPTDNIMVASDSAWRQTMRRYRIASGTFKMSGGFAGTTEQFRLTGDLKILAREGNLATFFIALLNADPAKKQRSLNDITTGVIDADGHLRINKLTTGSLVDAPNGGLKVSGAFSSSGSKISLVFNSLPTMVADGYQGEGTLEAELVDSGSKR